MINEKANEIQYQFTAMPLNLTLCLDNNCRVMLFALIQLSSHYADESGYFFRTNEDLKAQTNFSENLVRATLSTLYDNGIVNVRSIGKSKGTIPNCFKVNFDCFQRWEEISIEDAIKNPLYKIETADYRQKGFKVSYLKALEQSDEITDIDSKMDEVTIPKQSEPIEPKSEVIDLEGIQKPKTKAEMTMPKTAMDIARELMKQKRSQNTSPDVSLNPSQSEYNIDNIDNEDNINKDSLKATFNNSFSKTDERLQLTFEEYKAEEDRIMDKLYNVKTWSEFDMYRKDYQRLIRDNSNATWNSHTKKRFDALETARLKYFAKKCANEPYNPCAEEVYQRTKCGWKKNTPYTNEEDQEPQNDFAERVGNVQTQSQSLQEESWDNQWAAYCEKQHQAYLEQEARAKEIAKSVLREDGVMFDGNNLPF